MENNKNLSRLNKAVALSGISSRRGADELIKAGRVKVNGKVITDLSFKVSSLDEIKVDDKRASSKELKYVLLNKEKGYITTVKDELNRKTIYNLLPEKYRNLKPVGRLDRDTEGLLILSNDGDFINKVIHPSNKVNKTYIVCLEGDFNAKTVSYIKLKLKTGVQLDGALRKADFIKEIASNASYKGKQCTFEIVIHEGINRQVRRMFQAVGYTVSSLKRTKIGSISLNNINSHKYREIEKNEAYAIFESGIKKS